MNSNKVNLKGEAVSASLIELLAHLGTIIWVVVHQRKIKKYLKKTWIKTQQQFNSFLGQYFKLHYIVYTFFS